MTIKRISGYICALLLTGSWGVQTWAQSTAHDSLSKTQVRGIQYHSREEAAAALARKEIPLWSGISVSADLVGAVMMLTSPHGQWEAACRLNLKQRYFPTVEVGWGVCDQTGETTGLHYKTQAPYFRIGADYNFSKQPLSGNRILAGFRYAFSPFHYDLEGPPVTDPVWGTQMPFQFQDISANAQWLEFVFGLEARILPFFHMGWSVRYKLRLNEKTDPLGSAWHVPGYGRNDTHALGGTFQLIFDISGASRKR